MKRREFLRKTAGASVSTAMAPLVFPANLFAGSAPAFTDYKALVYVLLEGGNDAFNMVLPVNRQSDVNAADYPSSYDSFFASRGGVLAVQDADFTDALNNKVDVNGKLDFSLGNPYPDGTSSEPTYRSGFYRTNIGVGVNAVMPELAHMMNEGKVATIAGVGTLLEPLLDANNDRISGSQKPNFLGSHNTQRRYIAVGEANAPNQFGWVGRLFDEWSPGGVSVNGSDVVAPNVSFNGNDHALLGRWNSPLVLRTRPSGYSNSIDQVERDARSSIAELPTPRPFENLYNRMVGRSFDLGEKLVDIWAGAHAFSASTVYGDPVFTAPSLPILGTGYSLRGSLFNQLSAVLKMIEYGATPIEGVPRFKRQVFFVKFEGFDTHSAGTSGSTARLREISMGLYDFQNALEELGLEDNVTSFTVSDFGRSVGSNGDGTDHAWAGHNLVIGNAVNGGLYGDFPDWRRRGPQDNGGNGKIIPKIAVEQQLATLTRWFGVDDALNDTLFANLRNFPQRNLGFMKPVT